MEGPAEGLLPRQMVEAIQGAKGGVYRPVKVQLLHILAEIEDGRRKAKALVHGLGQHLLGAIHPDDLRPQPGQLHRQGTGAARQIEDKPKPAPVLLRQAL